MFPQFPQFKNIELADKRGIESITNTFPPYSDFYFYSLWSYDTNQIVQFSTLNNNLVVKFQEYSGDGFFYSFLGSKNVAETSTILLKYAGEQGAQESLKLIPEHNFIYDPVDSLFSKFDILEDPDNHDYLLSVDELIDLHGPRLHQKKKSLNKFLRQYTHELKIHELRDTAIHSEMQSVVDIWYSQSRGTESINETELTAIRRSLENAHRFELNVAAVYIGGKMRGFTIFECLDGTHIVSSFQKADKRYSGIFELLNQGVAIFGKSKRYKYVNIEQDLGLSGLRQAKRKYNPNFLKKYIIQNKK